MKAAFRFLSLYSVLGMGAFCVSAQAQFYAADPASLLGPKSTGRAGATVASELDHEAVYQNIAAAAFVPKYTITGAYLGAGDGLSVSIVDTKSGPVGGAISYTYRDLKTNLNGNTTLGNYRRSEERVVGGLFGRVSNELAVGGTFKYAYRSSHEIGISTRKSFNFDVGLKYLASPVLAFGFAGQNFMTDEAGLDVRTFTGGFEYIAAENLYLSAQISKAVVPELITGFGLPRTDQLVGWALGAQYKYTDVVFRAGYSDRGAWNVKFVGLGLGYALKNFSIDYAFEKSASGPSLSTHSFSLSAFL